jgi:hypothetical protein
MKKIGVLVLWGLAVLLAGCEKEGVLERSGEKVAVNISLGDVFYSGNETVTRGDAEEAETVGVPLGDGLFMYTRIEKNREIPTRAGEPLEDGVKVRVVAYNGSSVEGTVEYTVMNGALTTAIALEVYTETPYTFVAYSYNSTVSPTYPGPTITVDPANDLLYGKESKTITAADNSVYITMSHQFAQVKVRATTDKVDGKPVIKNMSGVSVSPGNPLDLTLETGAVAKNGTTALQAVASWTGFDKVEVLSNPITVYTGTANPIYLNINSVEIDEYDDPFTGIKAAFKKTLLAGYSYTLVISFQRTRWAKSNIYWVSTGGDTGYLTFDTNENGHQGYQGVFFKWGSLIGISPAQPDAFSGSTPIYVPIFDAVTYTNSSWKATTGSAMANDTDFPDVKSNWTAWVGTSAGSAAPASNIPYMDGSYAKSDETTYNRDNTYVIDVALNRDTTYQGLRGDICQYLSTKTEVVEGDWRLPKSSEFGPQTTTSWASSDPTVNPNADGWIKGIDPLLPADNATGYADGTADLLEGTNGGNVVYGSAKNRPMGDVIFTASGLRHFNSGAFGGGGGSVRSGSASGTTSSYHLDFGDSAVIPGSTANRSYGFPVRCIRK